MPPLWMALQQTAGKPDRPNPEGFAFIKSDWLQSLDEDRLGHLQQLAETALHDPQAIGTALEDLVSPSPPSARPGGHLNDNRLIHCAII